MAKRSGWVRGIAALVVLPAAGSGTNATAALPVPPTTIGVSLSSPAYYRQTRTFANLMLGASSWLPGGNRRLDPADLDKDGNPKRLAGPVFKMLVLPGTPGDADIRCTYKGHGDIRVTMSVSGFAPAPGSFTFHWRNTGYKTSPIQLRLLSVDEADPIRNIDCRETKLAPDARFAPEFLAMARPFKVLRFMDWQHMNANQPISWADRHTPASQDVLDRDGVSVEDMVDLVSLLGADPWFNMPWNADDDYVRRFAQYVHDHLPRGRKVYVETGNEVWNAGFGASRQALQEGTAKGLDANPEKARLYRYAERLSEVMTIWSQVFADRPGQLVRVANCQNFSQRAEWVLGYKDTAKHVDALATAPYFGFELHRQRPADLNEAFTRIDASIDKSLDFALQNKAIAAKYGKRYIAYEAGQHVIVDDPAMAVQIQRDPRMYDAYKRYLSLWRSRIGDTIMMYDSVQPVVRTGAWGLLEYLGQPLDEAPKMRATLDAIQGLRR